MPVLHVPPRDAHARALAGTPIVDVRTEEEFAEGHPEGALNIPIFVMGPYGAEPNHGFLDARFDPADDILFSCRTGSRSGHAAEILASQGYTGDLVNVLGGMVGGYGPDGYVPGWVEEGLPVSIDVRGRSWAELREAER